MALTGKEKADCLEEIAYKVDSIPVKNKEDFLLILKGLKDILNPGNDRIIENAEIQEHLSNLENMLNDSELGYCTPENFLEFQNIFRRKITLKIEEFEKMGNSEQTRYIEDQQNKANITEARLAEMNAITSSTQWQAIQKEHNTGEEETEEQMLARRQREFQAEGVPEIYFNNIYEIATLEAAGISLNQLGTINPELLAQFIENSDRVYSLIVFSNFSFEELTTVDIEVCIKLIEDADKIAILGRAGISFDQLREMPPEILNQFYKNIDEIQAIIKDGNMSVEQLITLDLISLTELINSKAEEIHLKCTKEFEAISSTFLQKKGISLDELFNNAALISDMHSYFFHLLAEMEQEMRNKFIKDAMKVAIRIHHQNYAVQQSDLLIIIANSVNLISILLNNIKISIEELEAISPEMLPQLIANAHILEILINDGDIDIDTLPTLDSTTFSELINSKEKEIYTKNVDKFKEEGRAFLEKEGVFLNISNNTEIEVREALNNPRLTNRMHTHFLNLIAKMTIENRSEFIYNANCIGNTYQSKDYYSFQEKSLISIAIDNTILIGMLINYANISIEELTTMNPEKLDQFIKNAYHIGKLIHNNEISVEQLLRMDLESCSELISNAKQKSMLELLESKRESIPQTESKQETKPAPEPDQTQKKKKLKKKKKKPKAEETEEKAPPSRPRRRRP